MGRVALRRAAIVGTALVLAAGPAACGGSDDGAPARTTAPAAAKADYERAMQAIVGATTRAVAVAERPGSEPLTRAALADLNAASARLRRLRPPAEVREAHRDYAAGYAEYTGRLRQALEAILRGDGARAAELLRQDAPREIAQAVLRARGVFAEHGYDITPPS